jgi:hypothetical protein
MKIETRVIDKEKGIVQITTNDERWYQIKDFFVPSVTWIAGHYPKGVQFYKWLAEKGWDESQAIKQAAGDKGSKVHNACEDILRGKTVKIDDKYLNRSTGEMEELSVEEYECLMSLVGWLNEVNPVIINGEYNVVNPEFGYAGTVDLKCKIGEEIWLVDFKTGQNIWPEYELQVSAYRHADPQIQKTAILQLGYKRNKNKYKFTEIEDKFPLFLAAKQIWQEECGNQSPSQKDYPLEIKWIKK